MAMTPLPDPPSRQDPDTFAAKSDALLGALPAFVTEANALQVDVTASKNAAAISAGAAASAVAGIDAQIAIAAGHAADAADQVVLAAAQVDLAEAQVALAAGHASDAAASAGNIALAERMFLGSKTTNPTLDNQGNTLLPGACYYNSVADETRVWTGTVWRPAASAVNGTANRYVYTATAAQTTFAAEYDIGFVDLYLNGVKLIVGVDFTATSGTSVILDTGAAAGDHVDIVAYGSFNVSNTYTQAQTDAAIAAAVSLEASNSLFYSLIWN